MITRRRVDEQKARKGCRVRIGSAGDVRIALGQAQSLGEFEVRMCAGEPPVAGGQAGAVPAAAPLPPLSVGSPGVRAGPLEERPDIPGYKILEPLGRGGMGMVWRAEQVSTRRQVALKLTISPRMESPRARARFQREVELTARLDHPNIARLYDSGLHQGMCYYAMELIDGVPLDQYVKSKALSRRQTLTLMRSVCQAVLFAHLHAVIHRDLKPSNILVSADGQPHVLDFGLAKSLLEEEEAPAISIEGQIAGTPAYMSPEQAAGHQNQIDTRTDVFSLGVILYELLTGQSPHDLSGSMFDVLQRVTEGRIRRPREADRSVDHELEALLLTALARNPEERYASAGALAKDIGNYLEGEPLDTRAHRTLYFLRKKAAKYRVPIAVSLVVSLVLLGIVLAAYTRIVAARTLSAVKDKEIEFKSAQLTWRELELKALGNDRQEAHAALRILRDQYVGAQDQISQLNHKLGEGKAPVEVRRVDLTPGAALAAPALVRRPCLPGQVTSWTLEPQGHRGPIAKLAYSPDGSQLASASHDGIVRIWEAQSGHLTKIVVDPNGSIAPAWFVQKGDRSRWTWPGGEPARTLDEAIRSWGIGFPEMWRPLLRTAMAAALSPDRTLLALGDHEGTIHVLDPQSGRWRYTSASAGCGPVQAVRFSSDGKVLATCAGPGTVCLWDAQRWQPLRVFEADRSAGGFPPAAGAVAWGPGDTVIARLNVRQDALEILDSQSGQVLRVLHGSRQKIASLSWSPDGTLLAAGAHDGKVLLWDMASDSNEPHLAFDAHTGRVNAVAWRRDSQSLITAGEDGKIKLWEPRAGKLTDSLETSGGPVTCLTASPDGQVLASGGQDGTVRLWNVKGRLIVNLLRVEPSSSQAKQTTVTAVAWSPDGALLASGDSAGNVRIWDPNSRQPRRSFPTRCESINALAWSPEGRVLLGGGADGTARAWEARNDFQEHVVLLPLRDPAAAGLAIGQAGDYRGMPGIADRLVYIVSTDRGQETLTPADFKERFGWVNEPWQVGLYAPGGEQMTRIYVKADAQPPHDGTRWDTAFNDLQDALSLAQPNTEIWVAAGTYRPDRGTGAREASFRLKKGIRLMGGFTGTETSSAQRDPNRNETILSGDLKGDDGPNFANYDDNSYHVLIADHTDASTTALDGFIITGGNANGPGPESSYNRDRCGGGLLGGDLTLIRCTFRYNSVLQEGGGIAHWGGSILQNCAFVGNRAMRHGGAVFGRQGHAAVTGCTFTRNFALGGGGAVAVDADGSTFIACIFAGNSTMLNQPGGSSFGGALFFNGYPANKVALINCRFVENRSDLGGGVFSFGCSLRFDNCLFNNNFAVGGGGALCSREYVGEPGSRVLSHCTIVANRSPTRGGGIDSEPNCGPVLLDCIIWNNTEGKRGTAESVQIQGGPPVINRCCVQGWTGKLGGAGNLGQDPLFVDPNGPDRKAGTLDDDFRLQPGSPCRNAGDNSALPPDMADLDKDGDLNEPIPFDLDGRPRIQNGVVDLGAYESD